MNKTTASAIETFDRDQLLDLKQEAKDKVNKEILLIGDTEKYVQTIKHEPIPRQMRLVLVNELGHQIRFNELTQEIEVEGKAIKPYEYDTAEHWFDKKFGIMGTKSQAQSALKEAANQNRYHPVREYLSSLGKTDLSIDLGLVAEKVLGLTDALSKAQVSAWLCGAVSKVFSADGSPFIEVLTLISPKQGIGKSEFFKTLASPNWFGDSFAQTDGDKDRILCLHRSWINEISELDQFSNKKEIKQLKGLISTTTDTIRVPYGSTMENKPRQFVIGATSNSQGLFAIDDEQRRFWAMEVYPTTDCGRLDIQWLRDNRDAIWATATRLYLEKASQSFQLTKEQRQEVIARNANSYQQESLFQDRLAQFLEEKSIRAITTQEALQCALSIINPNKKQEMEVTGILKLQGYQKVENQMKLGKRFRTLWVNDQRGNDFDPGPCPDF
jgi:predicted P-loop ATPase